MDLQPNHHQEATSSASASIVVRQQIPNQDSTSSVASTDAKTLRTSARVKAAKQKSKAKDQGKERETNNSEQLSSASAAQDTARITRATIKSKRSRESVVGKGKSNEVVEDAPSRASKRYAIDCHLPYTVTNLGFNPELAKVHYPPPPP